MHRPTRLPYRGRLTRFGRIERSGAPNRCAGVLATACTQGKRTQHGKPRGVVIADHASGLPVLRTLSLCTCCRQYPGAAAERIALLTSPSRISLPRNGSRVGLRIVLFEACSAFTRVTACTRALSPYIVTRYPKASATSLPP